MPKAMSLDLVDPKASFLAMTVLSGSVFNLGDDPLPLNLPEGCIGIMLVFDSEEAAQAHFKTYSTPVQTVQLKQL